MEFTWDYFYLATFFVVAMITGLLIPKILLIAFRRKLFDETNPRKIHKGAVPRLGGIAFFPAIQFSILLLFGVSQRFMPGFLQQLMSSSFTQLCFVTTAAIVLYLVGIADDLIGVKYQAKFAAQLLAALFVITGGIRIDNLYGLLGIYQLPFSASILLTILLIMFITNAVNLIDGIDGLASGLSAIACAVYGCIFYNAGLHVYGLLSFSTLGALLPFFYYNVFGNPSHYSKIFMGDTGALFIGLILSVLSLRICQIGDTGEAMSMAVAAYAPLLIPCFDVVRICLRRMRAHRNPFLPDKDHIHHKLLALGMGQRTVMVAIVMASLVFILINCWLSTVININLLLAVDISVWIGVNVILSRYFRKRARQ
ncbi:MAG: undecaprenyl/decaprenyl-phosphate alpha-N-acetylglucosaminyl 1-phosphate transferase [Coprobacter sp.]|nr:undecaprenyl/decaprenyl-phosphate alpha-N-acetylglucosaminyl 1-phosphate transferase [Coprobacter sp.]